MTEQNNDGVYLLRNTKDGRVTAYNDFATATKSFADALEEAYKLNDRSIRDWKLMALSYGVTNNFIEPADKTAVEPYKDGV